MSFKTATTAFIIFFLLLASSSFALEVITQGSGSADVTYDGTTKKYALQLGFDMDTDFSNPRKAVALFSKSSFEGSSNPRRIKFRVDSTKSGVVEANAENKRFIFIQDGGQSYYPNSSCKIEIQSTYTGGASSLFKGQIRSCIVLSAGIEHTVSARFEINGPATWKTKSTDDW